jgi:hypothetical protein
MRRERLHQSKEISQAIQIYHNMICIPGKIYLYQNHGIDDGCIMSIIGDEGSEMELVEGFDAYITEAKERANLIWSSSTSHNSLLQINHCQTTRLTTYQCFEFFDTPDETDGIREELGSFRQKRRKECERKPSEYLYNRAPAASWAQYSLPKVMSILNADIQVAKPVQSNPSSPLQTPQILPFLVPAYSDSPSNLDPCWCTFSTNRPKYLELSREQRYRIRTFSSWLPRAD